MNVDCQLNQLRGLMQLLRAEDEDSSDSESEHILGAKKVTSLEATGGPGAIKPKPKTESEANKPSPYDKLEDDVEKWDQLDEIHANLPQPEFKVSYKQAVTTEDLFLGMSNKTPSTVSCEDIVLEIKLPEETVGIDGMTLNVLENEVQFQSPKYQAKIPLPHPVDPNKGKAVYNNDHRVLKLTLRLKREYDYVNF